jgi:tetratricopeptide (TPR) repeat protein
METPFLSRFTPSLMTPDALEAIFVQRRDLLRNILTRIEKSALTSEKRHTLLVGPRGIGKTHLISMIYYQLQSVEALKDHILIAWLREEEWGVTCFRDLLLRILRALPSQGDDDQAAERRLAPVYALQPKEAEVAASNLIKDLVGGRTLVILTENLDDLIQKLGSVGEMQLYRFLQDNRFCCMVATSPGPVARVLPPGSPFRHDFFQVHQLHELNFDDAIQLISKIAQYQGDKALASLIASPTGRARVRALRYLAGGNHRAYVIFAPLLARESLDKLIKPLMQTIDDLTPYYNSRIAGLPLELRKIIEYVCEGRNPVRIADVAHSCFVNHAAASAHLESLCKMGHLQSFKIGNIRYYELHEPLMRLSFEVKKHRGKPIGLLLDFLRLWYSPIELKQKLAMLPPESELEHYYVPVPQAFEQTWADPRFAECCLEYNAAVQRNDYHHALQAAEELVAIRGLKQDLIAEASCLIHLGQFEQGLAVYDNLIGSSQEDATVWQLRAWALHRVGRNEEALSSCNKSIEIDSNTGRTWCYQASILLGLGRRNEALHSCETALKLDHTDSFALMTRGIALAALNLFEEAFAAFSKMVESDPQSAQARIHACAALIELNRCSEALKLAESAIEISPDEPEVWVLTGLALAALGRLDESLSSFKKAVSLGENSSFVQYKVVEVLFALDRWREGRTCLDRALHQFAHSENPNAGHTAALIRCLLPNLFTPRILQLSINVLLLTYRKHDMLGALGQGLIEFIPEVTSSTAFSDADAGLWRDSWQMMGARFPEFRLPLRLLDTAVRYRETQNLQVFMDLSQEERTLLEPLVGVHIEASA